MESLVNMLSWNVRGLGNATKRCAIFHALKEYQNVVICRQEMHMVLERMHLLDTFWVVSSFQLTIHVHKALVFLFIKIFVSILAHPSLPLLLVGDFNMYLNFFFDKYSRGRVCVCVGVWVGGVRQPEL